MKKNILIIGHKGYIGSRLFNDLKNLYNLTGIDAELGSDNYKQSLDIKSFDNFYKYDAIILLAGHSSVQMCNGNPISSYKNNVDNFLHVISKLNTRQKFIYASSSSVYGTSGTINSEAMVSPNITTTYDLTKRVIDYYAPLFDVEYYGLRFGTVNGWSPVLRTDLMINSMVTTAKTDNIIKVSNALNCRPILAMSDLVSSIIKIIDTPKDNRGIYNLSSFNETIGNIAFGVSNILKIPIQTLDIDTSYYSFMINTARFETTFNFTFTGSITSIVNELQKDSIKTKRDKYIEYLQ